ncbi:p-cumate dioxygenase small subunit [Gordonia polyisoprenivorans NBRC 16320 = JCM 10675]|uniref:Aromatic-ring-hydroxylating dioxygenase subunit beta n=1 Tax=Gordonia polyisoprenivorans TaxID=84595 RepID=A0A846WKV7_9ACTN|nr:aromatic-ring-hydroxylating dioxygenase subunit beta [Gordonia polyisoprenivorans]MBE7195324.1 aromatic-ring-hydroxylating dioxygenase subunit beta [Gordonia polyisoprenivorans]NKY01463.1 aromatic-ring-hydroxylating dioxygenase subunit beta [Gordonia polyisoprenivorans]OZC29578.1 p-cumate dioxygenase [Gordonia polyisoprenivorans]UZF59027.1 aromatic-ring-hydroxylating dioxygenase subunit beta [Gordonia polyisoprenivorans]WCB38968.1 aromatic-ring-hydroxylating dioxygenase subunit beta [Gordon
MVDVVARPNIAESMALSHEVEQFLYREAEMLDSWRLPEWLELFGPTGLYLIPSTDKPDGDPARDLFLVQDDRFLLEQRINSLMRRSAHAEYPHSRTRRLVSNVRVAVQTEATLQVSANFAVFRMRGGTVDTYIGHYDHILERDEDHGFRFLTRRSVLDLDALRPHGKVSIIL